MRCVTGDERSLTALIAAACSDCIRAEVFVATDGFGVTWKTYLNPLAQIDGTPAPKSIPRWLARILPPTLEWLGQRPLVTRQSYHLTGGPNEFSTDKARRLLGYQPRVSFEQAMQALSEHFRALRK